MRAFHALKTRPEIVCDMVLCALCEQAATAVQVLPGGRARPVCLLHDVPLAARKSKKPVAGDDTRDAPDNPPAIAAE